MVNEMVKFTTFDFRSGTGLIFIDLPNLSVLSSILYSRIRLHSDRPRFHSTDYPSMLQSIPPYL